MTPVMEALSSIGSYASAGISSAKTALISGMTFCYNTAINALSSVRDVAKKAYDFSASTYTANKKVADVALVVLGVGAAGAAAYAGRAYLPAMPAAISNLYSKK